MFIFSCLGIVSAISFKLMKLGSPWYLDPDRRSLVNIWLYFGAPERRTKAVRTQSALEKLTFLTQSISKSYKKIEIAGSLSCYSNSALEAELIALELGLKTAADRGINITTIFTDCAGLQRALINTSIVTAWWLKHRILNILSMLNIDQVNIEVIPREWNTLADKLAVHVRSRHGISLFHQGMDLPR